MLAPQPRDHTSGIDATVPVVSVNIASEAKHTNKDKIHENKGNGVDLSWVGITFEVAGRVILDSCTGELKQGGMSAILGPSGAGKTTLLNILSGRVGANWSGTVAINGDEINHRSFRNEISYVLQELAFFPTQTPREAFHFGKLHILSSLLRVCLRSI